MSIRAIRAAAPDWFRPAGEASADEPTEFKICGLTGHQQARVASEISLTTNGDLTFTAGGIMLLFEYGLLAWRNLVDDDGRQLEFSDYSPRQIQDMLAYPLQVELASAIFTRSFLPASDKKKS